MNTNPMLLLGVVAGFACLAACGPNTIDFDTLPSGVVADNSPRGIGDRVNTNSLLSDQYDADVGITFSSAGGAVFVAGGSNSISPPNAACPTNANQTAGYQQPTDIVIDRNKNSNACDIYVTLTRTSSNTRLTAFDVSGNAIGSATGNGSDVLRVNACGLKSAKLELTSSPGGQYCFDDVKVAR
jgi:hypothetical protein